MVLGITALYTLSRRHNRGHLEPMALNQNVLQNSLLYVCLGSGWGFKTYNDDSLLWFEGFRGIVSGNLLVTSVLRYRLILSSPSTFEE